MQEGSHMTLLQIHPLHGPLTEEKLSSSQTEMVMMTFMSWTLMGVTW